MSTQLRQRQVKLVLVLPDPGSLEAPPLAEGTVITDLRVQFTITKTITKEPNTIEVRVTNLSEDSRSQLQAQGTRVALFAGYEGQPLGQIFTGSSRTIDHVHEGPEWVTKIQCGDGELPYQFATVIKSYAPGTAIKQVLSDIVSSLKVDPGNALAQITKLQGQFASGYAMQGTASAALTSVLNGQGLEWSIQDGKLQVLAPNTVTNEKAVLVNAQSGLIGSPEHGTPTKIGGPGVLKFKTLLNPLLHPGRQVYVESRYIQGGYFGLQKVVHTGDTMGGDWYSTCEAWAWTNK
jgi:hypothetical protein